MAGQDNMHVGVILSEMNTKQIKPQKCFNVLTVYGKVMQFIICQRNTTVFLKDQQPMCVHAL